MYIYKATKLAHLNHFRHFHSFIIACSQMSSTKNSYFTRCKLRSSDSLQSSLENNAMSIFTFHYTALSQQLHNADTAKTASHLRAFFPPLSTAGITVHYTITTSS